MIWFSISIDDDDDDWKKIEIEIVNVDMKEKERKKTRDREKSFRKHFQKQQQQKMFVWKKTNKLFPIKKQTDWTDWWWKKKIFFQNQKKMFESLFILFTLFVCLLDTPTYAKKMTPTTSINYRNGPVTVEIENHHQISNFSLISIQFLDIHWMTTVDFFDFRFFIENRKAPSNWQ